MAKLNSLLKLKELRCSSVEELIELKRSYQSLVQHPAYIDQVQKLQRIIENLRDELEKEEGGEEKKRAMIFVVRQIQQLPIKYITMGGEAEKAMIEHGKKLLKHTKV